MIGKTEFARYMAKSRLLTVLTIIFMVVPFFYVAWYFAVAIAISVQVLSWIIRAAFMTMESARAAAGEFDGQDGSA
ncbi:hypothetical protein [Bradyrhizobium brasilense]|uniref:hypothetical protein n=1 Tax=Bradyrhizobium brasilense TaxID=1419277 RepID=UPI001E3C97E7|nr:hypothetical protein [Bradyrhizobium brasilense]MCC8976421.1 hypothetical protein [Bradyrhizobium brasilense]